MDGEVGWKDIGNDLEAMVFPSNARYVDIRVKSKPEFRIFLSRKALVKTLGLLPDPKSHSQKDGPLLEGVTHRLVSILGLLAEGHVVLRRENNILRLVYAPTGFLCAWDYVTDKNLQTLLQHHLVEQQNTNTWACTDKGREYCREYLEYLAQHSSKETPS